MRARIREVHEMARKGILLRQEQRGSARRRHHHAATLAVPVSGGGTFTLLAAGQTHVCALDPSGAAFCWGSDAAGQLGNGVTGGAYKTPVPVSGGTAFKALAAGASHTCGLTMAGAAYCWGVMSSGSSATAPPPRAPSPWPSPADTCSTRSRRAPRTRADRRFRRRVLMGSEWLWPAGRRLQRGKPDPSRSQRSAVVVGLIRRRCRAKTRERHRAFGRGGQAASSRAATCRSPSARLSGRGARPAPHLYACG